jgi:hypothetical protein
MWVATHDLPRSAAYPFYTRLNQILDKADFDVHVETLCQRFYADDVGRPGLPPGRYFRMLLLGYFEGLDSERAIAWRTAHSLSIRSFLGLELHEAPPGKGRVLLVEFRYGNQRPLYSLRRRQAGNGASYLRASGLTTAGPGIDVDCCVRVKSVAPLAVLVLIAALLIGCASTGRAPSIGATAPMPRTWTGLASYYGYAFDGKLTASGVPFDADAMVAAHPTLPFGTVVRVTNLKNGRSANVRIVDRGPGRGPRAKGVIIDVSRRAAQVLRFINDGRVRVRLEVLSPVAAKARFGSTKTQTSTG